MAWRQERGGKLPSHLLPFATCVTTSRSVVPGRTALGNSTTKYGWECTSGRGKVLLIPGGEAQACVYWFFDLSSLKFERNNENIYKSVQCVFCRKPKAFRVCTLGAFIQELFYLPLKKKSSQNISNENFQDIKKSYEELVSVPLSKKSSFIYCLIPSSVLSPHLAAVT